MLVCLSSMIKAAAAFTTPPSIDCIEIEKWLHFACLSFFCRLSSIPLIFLLPDQIHSEPRWSGIISGSAAQRCTNFIAQQCIQRLLLPTEPGNLQQYECRSRNCQEEKLRRENGTTKRDDPKLGQLWNPTNAARTGQYDIREPQSWAIVLLHIISITNALLSFVIHATNGYFYAEKRNIMKVGKNNY